MSENIVIYAGVGKVGKKKKNAIEREAKRTFKNSSVSALFWEMFKAHGSPKLKQDLEDAELEK